MVPPLDPQPDQQSPAPGDAVAQGLDVASPLNTVGAAGGPSGPASAAIRARSPRHRQSDMARRAGAKPPEKRSTRFLKDAAFVVVAAIVLSFLLKTFLIQSFYIPSVSMEPTLEKLDRVLVTKLAPGVFSVHRGDVVVFENPGGWITGSDPASPSTGLVAGVRAVAEAVGLVPADSKDFLIKRVIGMAGDRVSCEGDGAPVTVNGVPLDDTYVAPGAAPSEAEFSVVVPADAIWVMGDNRSQSADSRAHMNQSLGGAVALDDVVGVAQVRTWPLDRLALMRNPGRVFAAVPPPEGGVR
ncbi:MAG: signal peptidase I [Bifidobacteriaceae bacterium]|jgi:signal peptidase I|nr:signal peptidase I [Bifidobacteriaceae bacterium]